MALNPRLPVCDCHLCPWESGAMGGQIGQALIKRVIEELANCNVIVIATASDWDRPSLGYQNNLLKCYDANSGDSFENVCQLSVSSRL
jgi:hypothetical protein